MAEVKIDIGNSKSVSGSNPIVIVGPNGSGKTRYAVKMLGWNKESAMIPALRNTTIGDGITMQTVEQATNELNQNIAQHQKQYWQMTNEFHNLLIKLLSEHSALAMAFTKQFRKGDHSDPGDSKLDKLCSLWSVLFPGRTISFDDHTPKITSDIGSEQPSYSPKNMSDGEKVAVYLIAKVLDTKKSIMIIDEPEAHFHNRLACHFWNVLEDTRKDVRFVYITHDLPFALSRRQAQYIIIKSENNLNLVDLSENVPREVAQALLSAASFSIQAKRIVFCEGEEGKSLDHDFYSAWFASRETTVFPVGGCRKVAEMVRSYSVYTLVAGLDAIGIVDRDYYSDEYLESLGDGLTVLTVHEIENIFCLEDVFMAVAAHQGNRVITYESVLDKARNRFKGKLLVSLVLERMKRGMQSSILTVLNAIKPASTVEDTVTIFRKEVDAADFPGTVLDRFASEQEYVKAALSGDTEQFLRVFPGKVFINDFCSAIGMYKDAYVKLICSALAAVDSKEDPLNDLGKKLEAALKPILPPRKIEE